MNHPSNENIPSRSFSYHAFNFTFVLLLAVFFISLYTVALLKSNSRITLSGDNGRRICYQLSALKGNTLDVSLGYGIAGTKEVSGNTIRGRIRHKVFQDCSGVENNNVEVRRFSILG